MQCGWFMCFTVYRHLASSQFGLLWLKPGGFLFKLFVAIYQFLLGKCQGVILLDHSTVCTFNFFFWWY